ncbi:MAG: gliding motility lipoprotein GldB [Nonlabens sp.]
MPFQKLHVYWIFRVFVGFTYSFALLSCNPSNKKQEAIDAIPVDVQLLRFHEEFAKADTTQLQQLKQRYPRLFPSAAPDQFWYDKMTERDTVLTMLEQAVDQRSFDFDQIKTDIEDVQRHIKYYFPEFEPLPIITMISEVSYDRKVLVREEAIYLSIDTYLGEDHELYQGISNYKRENLNIEQIPADAALEFAKLFVEPSMDRSFLDVMIYNGKLHYLQSLFSPSSTGDQYFDYNPEKYKFVQENETQIWKYFVDRELLYKTDSKLLSRFITDAPFSTFYLEFDNETPGGVGRYIGYRIVEAFMANNDLDLDALLSLPADRIINESGYKPL